MTVYVTLSRQSQYLITKSMCKVSHELLCQFVKDLFIFFFHPIYVECHVIELVKHHIYMKFKINIFRVLVVRKKCYSAVCSMVMVPPVTKLHAMYGTLYPQISLQRLNSHEPTAADVVSTLILLMIKAMIMMMTYWRHHRSS